MKKLILILTLVLTAHAGFSQTFSATDGVAVTNTKNTGFNNSSRGFSFSPNSTITITSLGAHLPSVNATATYTWTIWNATTQASLYTQTIVTPISGAYFYEAMTTPLTLNASTTYIISLHCNASAAYYFGTSSQVNTNLTYGGAMRYCNNCSAATFPASSLNNYHYGLVDFMFNLGSMPHPIKNNEISLGQSTRGMVLSWKTEDCNTNEHYIIEKSTDNEKWNVTGNVNCSPNTTLQFTDENPINGVNYYRLKVMSLGQSYTYTNTVSGNWNSKSDISIFPNPLYNEVTVSYNASKASNAVILIYDMLGKTVIAKKHNITLGMNNIIVNTSELAEGTYTIVIKENNAVIQKQTIQKIDK